MASAWMRPIFPVPMMAKRRGLIFKVPETDLPDLPPQGQPGSVAGGFGPRDPQRAWHRDQNRSGARIGMPHLRAFRALVEWLSGSATSNPHPLLVTVATGLKPFALAMASNSRRGTGTPSMNASPEKHTMVPMGMALSGLFASSALGKSPAGNIKAACTFWSKRCSAAVMTLSRWAASTRDWK